MYDKRKVPSEKWVGVVLRNIPPDQDFNTIKINLERNSKTKVIGVECLKQITKISKAAIVRVIDIEMAEIVCKEWNNYIFK